MTIPPKPQPYDSSFDDAWLKFHRGVEHAKTLHAELTELQELQSHVPGSITTFIGFQPKANRFSIVVGALEPYPKRFSLILGDILHNYRSALDAATWAAVQRGSKSGSLSISERKRVAFPDLLETDDLKISKYSTLREHFTKRTLDYRAPGISRPDAAVLRWAQRFDLIEKSRANQPLTLLAKKNNVDKHKTLEILLRKNTAYLVEVIEQRECIVNRVEPRSVGEILVLGTELARVIVTPTGPNPLITVDATVVVDVTLDQVPSLLDFLNTTRRFVVAALLGFSDHPSNIGETPRVTN